VILAEIKRCIPKKGATNDTTTNHKRETTATLTRASRSPRQKTQARGSELDLVQPLEEMVPQRRKLVAVASPGVAYLEKPSGHG
jgi:hypothetical protein